MARLSELIDFEHWCFACGRLNPHGLHLDFEVVRDRAQARFVARQEHSGYAGSVHGGIVTALIDETMGWAIFQEGVWGVTGRITVSFRKPVPVGEELLVTGEITKRTHRGIETRGAITNAAGQVLADGQAL
ncbi:MAG TPA: PaaI family thioesterase, partial [Candidatus Limnocylindrales bacterium]|nr:PaaI family thioesterase [Candidatus Limnocylindrales bacterium]